MTRSIFSVILLLLVFVQYSLARTGHAAVKAKSASKGVAVAPVPERAVVPARVASSKTTQALCSHIENAASAVKSAAHAGTAALEGHLARLTAYWSGEDYYTRKHLSSTGVHLHEGHCAVDPKVIPYGSVVQIPGLGKYLAVDTGTAVVSRKAAREAGHNRDQRNALVVDLYFENRHDGEKFAALGPRYASITWSKPASGEEIELGAAKSSPESKPVETKLVETKIAVVKVATKEEPKIAVVKSRVKKNVKVVTAKTPVTEVTKVATSKSVTEETKTVATTKSILKDSPKITALQPSGKSAKKTSDEDSLLAEDNGSPHRKPLYTF